MNFPIKTKIILAISYLTSLVPQLKIAVGLNENDMDFAFHNSIKGK